MLKKVLLCAVGVLQGAIGYVCRSLVAAVLCELVETENALGQPATAIMVRLLVRFGVGRIKESLPGRAKLYMQGYPSLMMGMLRDFAKLVARYSSGPTSVIYPIVPR